MAELHAWRVTDADAWNDFATAASHRSFPQLWEWGELRQPFGWRPVRIMVGERQGAPLAGAQVLIRDVPLFGWRLGYAPRGPIGDLHDEAVRTAAFAALRALARRERSATLQGDPGAESVLRFIESQDVLMSATKLLKPAAVFLQAEGAANESITIVGGAISKAAARVVFKNGAAEKSVKLRV